MYPPPDDLEQAAEIAAVETALASGFPGESDALAAYTGRLSDGTEVRLFALHSAEEKLRAEFDRLRSEWETYDQQPSVSTVHASGDQPVPWIAVEHPPGESFLDVAPTLSPVERRSVLAEIAETLWRADTPHLVPTPAHIRIDHGEGLELQVDWAVGRIPLQAGEYSENPYIAPELREEPTAGDQRSDVYTLGALARYAVTGREPELEPDHVEHVRRRGHTTEDTTQWLSSRAMSADPEKRFESCYAFKRGALFGESERTTPESRTSGSAGKKGETESGTDANSEKEAAAERRGDTGRPESKGGPTVWERTGRRRDHEPVGGAEYGTHGARHGQEEPQDDTSRKDKKSRWEGNVLRWLDTGSLSRRQSLGGAAGVALLGVAGLGYWNRDDSEPSKEAGTEIQPEITVDFDAGLIELTNTGSSTLDPKEVLLRGTGFLSARGRSLAGYTDDEFSPGSIVRLVADPAYELNIFYGRDDPTRIATSEGPEAAEREPRAVQLYTPDLDFTLEKERGDRLLVRYAGEAPVRADQIQLVGTEFRGAPVQRWSERMELDDDHRISRGDFTWVATSPETVFRVEWAPPSVGQSTTVAQYEGTARPLDGRRGGIGGPRYDVGNTGAAPAGSEVRNRPTEAWSVVLDDSPGESLALAGGRLFVSTGTYLYAIDSVDGEVSWRRHIGSSTAFGVSASGGRVFVGTSAPGAPARLLALDVTDGSKEWEFTTDAPSLWAPTVTENLLFTGGTGPGGSVYALDPRDGSSDTTVEGVTQVRFSAFERPYLYIRSIDGDIEAVNPGGVEWSYPAERMASPTVTDGVVYGGDSGTGQLFAVDAADGSEQWTFETDGNPTWPQAVTAETVFVGTDRGMVHAVDADSGEKRWSVKSEDRFAYGPVAAGETVYIAGAGSLSALASEDGRNRWTLDFETRIVSEPAVSDGWLYLGFADGEIVAFEG